jgi:hypothetical protein
MAVVPPGLAALSNEATSLLERARQLHTRMEELPAGDPQRAQLEVVIRDLLKSANSLSDVVQSNIPKP